MCRSMMMEVVLELVTNEKGNADVEKIKKQIHPPSMCRLLMGRGAPCFDWLGHCPKDHCLNESLYLSSAARRRVVENVPVLPSEPWGG